MAVHWKLKVELISASSQTHTQTHTHAKCPTLHSHREATNVLFVQVHHTAQERLINKSKNNEFMNMN
jgi:hypothetical protein